MIATTREQSARLLDAGLTIESADMFLGHIDFGGVLQIDYLPANPHIDISSTIAPAWSLSALWDIVHNLDKTYDFDTKMSSDELMELLVKTIEFRFKNRTSG